MAAQVFQNSNELNKREIQAAISKAVELRALHAALMNGNNSPANLRFPNSLSPSIPRPSTQFSAQDYPVFTPSYEEEPLPGYLNIRSDNRNLSEDWDGIVLGEDYRTGLSSNFQHICSADDHKSPTGSCANHITVLQTSPGPDIFKSGRRTSSGEFKSITTCNKCKPATISIGTDNCNKNNHKNSNTVVPISDSRASFQSHPKNKGPILSWLFPRLKKKPKTETSPNRVESEDTSQIYKDWGILSLESLKKELLEANENRDAALMEVTEMKSSFGELKHKLETLETYCEELKKALKQTKQGKDTQLSERPNHAKRGKPDDTEMDGPIPVSHEVMVEGFLQIVSEARLSIKQFCKTLLGQIEETDDSLMEKLNFLLHPYKLTPSTKYSKGVLYHLEALINQSLYQDFENCVFQKNGSVKYLNPQQDREEKFSAFVALRNLSWNEVLRKGTKYYSEEFSGFCDQKMSCIITILNWSRPWPEQLLQSFFVAAKCIWLVHLLAFSFHPPLAILRVDENRDFDPLYMEDILLERQRSQAPARVKVMIMPGFYVQDKVLKCKVLCRYKTGA